ncbi:small heat shock protein p36-like isoform X3 [Watersipora subatra]|uniref:small heat shock protein p36-like isoform X3 n=1 Tax=Watersipora subatra TaxID=2589382 RepID=UPI00355B3A54
MSAEQKYTEVRGPAKTFSSTSTFSSSSTNRTVARNGGKPETTSESVESHSTTSSGDPISPINREFSDNFEELKRSILSGDAYKRNQRVNQNVERQRGQQQFKPAEGVTTIRPVRPPVETPIQPVKAKRVVNFSSTPTKTKSGPNSPPFTDRNSNHIATSPKMMNNYKTEMHIPVRRHHGDFDDFFKNRWLEHNTSHMDTEFDRRRIEWESKLDDMKRGFFNFSPFGDHHSQNHHYEAANAIQPLSWPFPDHRLWKNWPKFPNSSLSKLFPSTVSLGPTGNPEFAVRFNVKDFKPEEINVSTKGGRLTISATHEEKSGNSTSRKESKRTVDIPNDVQIGLMRSTLSKDGILSITAPIRPPNYLPGQPHNPALQSSAQITQQHANAVSSSPVGSVVTREADTGDALNYSLSIAGYQPQEVTVTVEGRKVTVHAKHEEDCGGRKVHNEMTKSFDLPPTVNAHNVRSYIKDGSTLFIEAHLRDDLAGKIHLVPVTHKSF